MKPAKSHVMRVNVPMREVPHKEIEWSTAEVFKVVPLQERDIIILQELANEPGLFEPHQAYDIPITNPDGDKLTIEDFLTPNAEFETRGRPARRKRFAPPSK